VLAQARASSACNEKQQRLCYEHFAHVWWWVLTMPGMTTRSERLGTSSPASYCGGRSAVHRMTLGINEDRCVVQLAQRFMQPGDVSEQQRRLRNGSCHACARRRHRWPLQVVVSLNSAALESFSMMLC